MNGHHPFCNYWNSSGAECKWCHGYLTSNGDWSRSHYERFPLIDGEDSADLIGRYFPDAQIVGR